MTERYGGVPRPNKFRKLIGSSDKLRIKKGKDSYSNVFSSVIYNDSTVSGTKVTDALDTLGGFAASHMPLAGGTFTGDVTWAAGINILSAASGTSNIGSPSLPFANVYADDLYLKGNSVYVKGMKFISLKDDGSALDNLLIGHDTGSSLTIGDYNTIIGQQAGPEITDGSNNVILGQDAGNKGTTIDANVFVGRSAGYNNVYGYDNVVIGYQAGIGNAGDDEWNDNVVVGARAGSNLGQQSNFNVLVGARAGYTLNDADINNVMIGYSAGLSETGSNKLYIESSSSITPLIYGEFDNDFVTINGDFNVTGTVNVASGTGPATSSGTGTIGDITWDSGFVYVCVDTNTWKRSTISTW